MTQKLIKLSFRFSVWLIEKTYDMKPNLLKAEELRKLPEGTLGNDIAKCLDENKLHLVPNFESHDLKHVLLDFKMTPIDEIRMQAFMLGNGNYSIPCVAILIFGMLLLPNRWITFYKDFKRGKRTLPISTWSINAYAEIETTLLREMIFDKIDKKQAVASVRSITKFAAFSAIAAGIFGMLFCLPFLFSSSITDITGAGFPFVGGAILCVGGLLTLSNLVNQTSQS